MSDQLKLHHLKPAPGSKSRKIRVGRGESGRRGKTAGRGTKGQKARGTTRPGFEGGQSPLIRRLPKLKGFKNRNKEYYALINVGRLADFDAGTEITPEMLRDLGLVKHRGRIKVLGEGDIDVALTVSAHAFSLGAVEKIKAAGGSVTVVE